MSLSENIIAVGGENLIDRVQSYDGEFVNNSGGSPYNVAIALAKQGAQAHYLTPISTDDMGDILMNGLTEAGVQIAAERRIEPTTLAIVTLEGGIPSYTFQRDGTAERCVSEQSITLAMPYMVCALHVGSLALIGGDDANAWEAVIGTMSESGHFVSIDPNVRPSLIDDPVSYRARLIRCFKCATLIKLSDEDLEWIYPGVDQDDALQLLFRETNPALLVLTKGPDGAEAMTSNVRVHVAAPPVPQLVDTIGAGDTFMGTLLARLSEQDMLIGGELRRLPKSKLELLLTRAAQAAALNCAQAGCVPPTKMQIDAALSSGTIEI